MDDLPSKRLFGLHIDSRVKANNRLAPRMLYLSMAHHSLSFTRPEAIVNDLLCHAWLRVYI
jgi:hypothetical protein